MSFNDGAALNSTSIGNLKLSPTAATHLGISLPLIGALFYAYYDALAFYLMDKFIPLVSPAIICVLLKKR